MCTEFLKKSDNNYPISRTTDTNSLGELDLDELMSYYENHVNATNNVTSMQNNYDKTLEIFKCCDIEMCKGVDNTMMCSNCQRVVVYHGDLNCDYTNSNNTRIIVYGRNARFYKHKTFTANQYNYEKVQTLIISELLERMQALSQTTKFDTRILHQTKLLCCDIIKNHVFRRDFLVEIITASLYIICLANGYIKQDHELILYTQLNIITKTKSKSFSNALTTINQMALEKLIELPEIKNEVDIIIDDFGDKLMATDSDRQIVRDLLKILDDKGIIQCMITSKIAGCYYFVLNVRHAENTYECVKIKQHIEKLVKVNSSTYTKVFKCICDYISLFKPMLLTHEFNYGYNIRAKK